MYPRIRVALSEKRAVGVIGPDVYPEIENEPGYPGYADTNPFYSHL